MGLLDSLFSGASDPSQAGLLGAAMSMLQASGPSRMPTSTGQVLAQGMNGGLQGVNNAYDLQQKQIANQTAKYGLEKQQWMMGLLGRMMGDPGSQPSAAGQAPAQPQTPGLPVMGGTSGMNAPQQPPMGGAPQGGLPLPGGMTPQQMAIGTLFPNLMPGFLPTNEARNARDPIIGPATIQNTRRQSMSDLEKLQDARKSVPDGSPEAAQIDDAISKANYLAPVDIKPGTPVADARTLAIKAFAPKLADGVTGDFGNVNGVSTMTSAYPIPGYSPANAGIAGAEQRAKQGNTFNTVTGPNGAQQSGFVNDLIANAGDVTKPSISGPAPQTPARQAYVGPGTIPSARIISSQSTPKKLMADQQEGLANQDSVYQQSRSALKTMLDLSANPGFVGTASRLLPDSVASRISNTAAEYGKQHANFVGLQGKALGGGGTDASRATIDESVPTWEKPTEARIAGLNAQLNQLDLSHIKRVALSPTYEAGNEKQYTDLSQRFDNTIKPSMMPQINHALSLPPGPQRAQALQALASDPGMKSALSLLAETGALK